MKRATLLVLSGVIIAVAISRWAVPSAGAAHLFFTRENTQAESVTLPGAITFREADGRGLLVKTWVNGRGPFTFAIDTGAGMSVISRQAAGEASLVNSGQTTVLTGLSGKRVNAGRTRIERLALGWSGNVMPGRIVAAVTPTLPAGVDGILDPTDAYAPFGYIIDYPAKQIRVLDPRSAPLDPRTQPSEGAVVRWHRESNSHRPFVKLSDGRLALLDTGSDFGLAITQARSTAQNHRQRGANDVGGGAIVATRVAPSTVNIGGLLLENVPTDVLNGTEKGAPVILGRDALYPFRLTFDPVRRLIEIVPSNAND